MFYYTPAVHSAAFQLPAYVDRVVGQRAIRGDYEARRKEQLSQSPEESQRSIKRRMDDGRDVWNENDERG